MPKRPPRVWIRSSKPRVRCDKNRAPGRKVQENRPHPQRIWYEFLLPFRTPKHEIRERQPVPGVPGPRNEVGEKALLSAWSNRAPARRADRIRPLSARSYWATYV